MTVAKAEQHHTGVPHDDWLRLAFLLARQGEVGDLYKGCRMLVSGCVVADHEQHVGVVVDLYPVARCIDD